MPLFEIFIRYHLILGHSNSRTDAHVVFPAALHQPCEKSLVGIYTVYPLPSDTASASLNSAQESFFEIYRDLFRSLLKRIQQARVYDHVHDEICVGCC